MVEPAKLQSVAGSNPARLFQIVAHTFFNEEFKMASELAILIGLLINAHDTDSAMREALTEIFHKVKLLERQKAETEALNAALTLKLKELRK